MSRKRNDVDLLRCLTPHPLEEEKVLSFDVFD
jgi:hypothetical protein